MSRDDRPRRDWWLVGCAVLAIALASSTAATIVSDERAAHDTFVAPGSLTATPSPSHHYSQPGKAYPVARPVPGAVPVSTRSR